MPGTPATNSISKTITSPSGADATYWRIQRVVVSVETMSLTAEVHGYLSVDGQQAGNAALDTKTVTASGGALAGIVSGGGALLTALATWIVANDPSFTGGTVN